MDERIPVEQQTVSYNAPDTFVPTTGLSVKVSDIEAIVRRVVAEVDRSGGDFFRCKMCGGRKERETDHCGCGQTRWHVEFSGDRPQDIPDETAASLCMARPRCYERYKRIEEAARELYSRF